MASRDSLKNCKLTATKKKDINYYSKNHHLLIVILPIQPNSEENGSNHGSLA